MSGGLFGRLFPQAYAESLGAAPPQSNVGEGGMASPFSLSIPAAFGVWPSTSPFTQSGQGPVPSVYSPQPFDPNVQYRALRPALSERGAIPAPVHPGMTPIPVAQVQAGQASGNLQAPESAPNAFSTSLGDFYRRTILQAGKDIAGYATDAVQDPLGFLHAIGPSLAGIGPTLGEVPFVARGLAGESRLPAAPRPNVGDLNPNLTKGNLPEVPSLPETLIGKNARPGRNRSKTDLPGVDPEELFDRLTGGQSDTLPGGIRRGPNGIRLRPDTGDGPRIDIPANGEKEHETIHFPPRSKP